MKDHFTQVNAYRSLGSSGICLRVPMELVEVIAKALYHIVYALVGKVLEDWRIVTLPQPSERMRR